MANLPGAWPLLKPLLTDILPDGFVTFQFFFSVQNCCNSSVCKTTDLLSRGKTYHNNYIFLQVVVVRGTCCMLYLLYVACLYCHPITLKHLVIFTPSIPSSPFRGYHKSRVEKNPNFGLQPQ